MMFLVVIFILKLITHAKSNGPGTVFVNLISYQNPSGKTDSGTECDPWFKQFIQDKCDLVFSVCLKNADNKSQKFPCDVGSISTLNHVFHDMLRVKFLTNIGFIPNPFNFTLTSMPETVRIGISITDDDISGQELISELNHISHLPIVSVPDDIAALIPIVLSSTSSEMVFTMYGSCKENYYGSGCKTFCRPSFSKDSGFYACDRVSGEKHCLIGWTGDGCRYRDLCMLENPCHGSATCTMVGSVANCLCPDSLTGRFCQTPKRPCDSSPCLNGGVCVRNPEMALTVTAATICVCPRNFTGDRCQNDFDECYLFPCKNEADCVNTFGSYSCNCKNNYWGINCEKPPVFSVKGIDSAFFIKTSTARFMQNMIIVLLIAVICLICVIGLLSFLYCKNRTHITKSQSIGSIYSECHFDEKVTHVTDFPNEDEVPYANYYELENEAMEKSDNITNNKLAKEAILKCYEKESVI